MSEKKKKYWNPNPTLSELFEMAEKHRVRMGTHRRREFTGIPEHYLRKYGAEKFYCRDDGVYVALPDGSDIPIDEFYAREFRRWP